MIRAQYIKMKKIFIFCFTFKKGAVLRLAECSHVHNHNTKGIFVSKKHQKLIGNRIGKIHKNTKYRCKNTNRDIYIDKIKGADSDAAYKILYRFAIIVRVN